MTFEDYIAAVTRYMNAHPSQRFGQALFNVLDQTHPQIASLVHGTDLDPFYEDTMNSRRIRAFTSFVYERLAA